MARSQITAIVAVYGVIFAILAGMVVSAPACEQGATSARCEVQHGR
jgi:hypothetical protein